MKIGWIKSIFMISGLYDGIVGVTFLFAAPEIFAKAGVTPPNHFGYIQFSALLLIIFGAMFVRISTDPVRWRELIWYGVGLKVSYSGVVFYHLAGQGLPFLWVPFAILDVVFLAVFLVCLRRLKSLAARAAG